MIRETVIPPTGFGLQEPALMSIKSEDEQEEISQRDEPEIFGPFKIVLSETSALVEFDVGNHPVETARMRDLVEEWATVDPSSLANETCVSLATYRSLDQKSIGHDLRLDALGQRTGPKRFRCVERWLGRDCPDCESPESTFARQIFLTYRGIDLEGRIRKLVDRLTELNPREVHCHIDMTVAFGVALRSKQLMTRLRALGVSVQGTSTAGNDLSYCTIHATKGEISLRATSYGELEAMLPRVLTGVLESSCARQVKPNVSLRGPTYHLETSFFCESFPLARLWLALEASNYKTLAQPRWLPGRRGFLSLTFWRRTSNSAQRVGNRDTGGVPHYLPLDGGVVRYYPLSRGCSITIHSEDNAETLSVREEFNWMLRGLEVYVLQNADPKAERKKCCFEHIQWRSTLFALAEFNVNPRLDILEEFAPKMGWNTCHISMLSFDAVRLSHGNLGSVMIYEFGLAYLEALDKECNLGILRAELERLLDKVALMALADLEFTRRFVLREGYSFGIIARSIVNTTVSLIAYWPQKDVLVLARKNYRLPGFFSAWKGVYYFSPSRTRIERFLEMLAGASPHEDEIEIVKFMRAFNESERRKLVRILSRRPYVG